MRRIVTTTSVMRTGAEPGGNGLRGAGLGCARRASSLPALALVSSGAAAVTIG